MIVDCNRMWTQLVSVVYRLRRKPMVSNATPPIDRREPRRDEAVK